MSVRVASTARSRALNLLRTIQSHPPACPCHSNPSHHHHLGPPSSIKSHVRKLATPVDPSTQKDYAFEMAASSIRFGRGVTKEVGMDVKNYGGTRVMVVTDKIVSKLDALKQVEQALGSEGVQYTIYDKVRVEPKDSSIREAIEFAKPWRPDLFIAVGGGSVIDTAKLMNLYTSFPGTKPLDTPPVSSFSPLSLPLTG